jgi:TM2 domain-containing membrane protein YozV
VDQSLQPLDEGPLTVAMARDKSIAFMMILSIVLPGTAEMYLGGKLMRAGLLRLATFALGWLLVLGIVGILIVPFVWLMSIVDGLRYAFKMSRLRREAEVREQLPL